MGDVEEEGAKWLEVWYPGASFGKRLIIALNEEIPYVACFGAVAMSRLDSA